MGIEQLEWLCNQEWTWLYYHDPNLLGYIHPEYNRHRETYQGYYNMVMQYYNNKEERKNKLVSTVLAAGLSGLAGLAGIAVINGISNSADGAKFVGGLRNSTGILNKFW